MAEGNVATPFLEMRSFVREDSEVFPSEALTPALGSPFVSVYELDGQAEYLDPEQEAYETLVQDLYDEEFDEALFELMVEARGLHEEHMVSNAQSVEGERLLTQHFNQLIRESENAVSAFEREFGSRDAGSLGEAEVDAFAERYSPATQLNPEFENFFGKLLKKVGGFVKKAGKFALKVGLGPVLNKLKGLIKPLLNKVLQMAIGKLPEAVRPAAQQLADRLFNRKPKSTDHRTPTDPSAGAGDAVAPEGSGSGAQAPAGANVTEIQQEFDQQIANLFLASDEVEMELEVARARSDERGSAVPVYAELDQARERFIQELEQLRDGEDAGPQIQNFVQAILPALRLGIKLIGRGKVVNFLANLLAKLIAKLIGPAAAPALSKAIVDIGLRMMTLEVSPQDEARVAASSVAATVEETVRRVSALPDYVLDNQELLEGFALEAFEQAAAANLPPVLSEAVYRERPDLLESQSAKTCWVMLPLRRRKRYKKCGRTFKVRISPYMADEIESFEGPLSDYLHDQLGVEEGAEVEAEVSLYETLPGTTLPDIAREESETPGQGSAMSAAQLHPLTPKAAGLLLGEPRMGRNVAPGTNRHNVGPGHRLYHLNVTGRRMLTAPAADGRPRARRSGGLRLTLDCPKDEIRMRIFLSEVKAQRMAVRLRRQSHPGTAAAWFRQYVGRRLAPILRGELLNHVRLIQPGLPPVEALGVALKRLPPEVSAALATKLQESVVIAFAEFVKTQSQRVIAATEDTADGITMKFTIARLPGLQQIGKALLPSGSAAGLAEAIRGGAKPDVRVEVHAGYKR
jgi:hypothetical protein